MPMTEQELAGLSDDEREALEAEDGDETEDDAAADDDGDDDGEPEQADPDIDAQPGDEQPDDVTEDQDTVAADQFVPRYQVDPVEGFDDKMAALQEEKKQIRAKHLDGDLEIDEYEEQRDAIESKIMDLREQNLKASMAAEQDRQIREQKWFWEIGRFLDQNKEYKDNQVLFDALDATVKRLGQDATLVAKHPDRWFLEEADRIVRKSFGLTGQTAKPAAKPSAKQQRPQIPPNLGDMPSAELPDVGAGSEWAHLERLGGMELEAALAKMSDAEQDRYLRGE